MEPQKLPIGIQDFESLRDDSYLYVDKTALVYRLVSSGKYFFLTRPRRFGKSLLVSTLKAYFEGKRHLFSGLEIDSLEKRWESVPVLHLDLNAENYDMPQSLDGQLNAFLSSAEDLYGRSDAETSFSLRFSGVIRRAYEKTGQKVAILVDEYDKPILQSIGNNELQNAFRSKLKGFYGALKSMDGYIRFAFITGVTRFSKVSIFSDLNNLNDISMDLEYNDLCGINEKELSDCFAEHIDRLAGSNGISRAECMNELRRRYDGYRFEENADGIYNPYSLFLTFSKLKFGDYWFQTGTPSYLVYLLQTHNYNLAELSGYRTDAYTLNSIDGEFSNPLPVIYQSGYLTIKDFNNEFGTYTLGFPNAEVEQGFTRYLMPFYIHPKDKQVPFNIDSFVTDLRTGNTMQFIERLKTLFADTPYELVKDFENHYQNVIWLLAKLLGFYSQAEYRTSCGRIDLVVKTEKFCYVMEFKLDGSAEEAMARISDRNYTMPFELDSQKVIRIGMNFSKKTRNIENAVVG